MAAILPDLNQLQRKDFESVYEPSDDTFLLCDALEGDRLEITASRPKIALEIGSGSGCVITFLAKLLKDSNQRCYCVATDINSCATTITQRLSKHNKVCVDIINTDLVMGMECGLCHKVDILLFNPPYVPTPPDEVGGCGIAASWAGGLDGRVVIDRFLPLLEEPDMITQEFSCVWVSYLNVMCEFKLTWENCIGNHLQYFISESLLSPLGGRCYMVLVEENKPKDIITYALKMGMHAKIVLKRRAANEGLQIMKIWKGDATATFL